MELTEQDIEQARLALGGSTRARRPLGSTCQHCGASVAAGDLLSGQLPVEVVNLAFGDVALAVPVLIVGAVAATGVWQLRRQSAPPTTRHES